MRVFARRSVRRSIRGFRSVTPKAEQPEVEADDATHADRDLIGVPVGYHRKESARSVDRLGAEARR